MARFSIPSMPPRTTHESETLLFDDAYQLAYLRRYSDLRFYKGVDYIDSIEPLADRPIAQCIVNGNALIEAVLPRGVASIIKRVLG
jgi:hypothetical protein